MSGVNALTKVAAVFSAAGFLLFCGNAAGQGVTKTAPVPRHITLAGPQRTQEPRPQRPVAQGTIEGYVYWDSSSIKHSPPNSCDGVSVTANGASGTFATAPTYIALTGKEVTCRYALTGLPVQQDLQVQANITSPAAFSSQVLALGATTINISIVQGGPGLLCDNPHMPPYPTPAQLVAGGWETCDDRAFNVNFRVVDSRLSSINRVAGPVRVAPGIAVQQAHPGSGALMTAGGQRTMIAASQRPLLADGSKSSSIAVQRSAVSNGTITAARPANTPQVGTSQTMSAEGNAPVTPIVSTGTVSRVNKLNVASLPRTTAMARTPMVQMDPNAYVAQACAKDPTFRVLMIGGSSDGVTIVVGHQYTIWGCSLGNLPNPKQPKSANSPKQVTPSSNSNIAPGNEVDLYFSDGALSVPFTSWSDSSITVTIPYIPVGAPGTSVPVELFVRRPDNQVISEDIKYQIPGPPPGPPPATLALAGQDCTKDNTFRIVGVYPTYGSGPETELRPNAYYTIAGCSFGSRGTLSLAFLWGSYASDANSIYLLGGVPSSWSDTQIVIFVDMADLPYSVPDGVWPSIVEGAAYPLTVEIERADTSEVIKPGFTFLLKP